MPVVTRWADTKDAVCCPLPAVAVRCPAFRGGGVCSFRNSLPRKRKAGVGILSRVVFRKTGYSLGLVGVVLLFHNLWHLKRLLEWKRSRAERETRSGRSIHRICKSQAWELRWAVSVGVLISERSHQPRGSSTVRRAAWWLRSTAGLGPGQGWVRFRNRKWGIGGGV